ncbi:collagen alpha-6(VI) chain-like [Haliotis asinina]|uniref:collagen alpha-6(VI) chain-like n=1 Tax=Haliotis asinina TaxID=109174 RepID=UPI0035324041
MVWGVVDYVHILSIIIAADKEGYDIIFMMDETARLPHFDWIHEFVQMFVSSMDVESGEYRVGAMAFSQEPNTIVDLDEYMEQQQILDRIDDKFINLPRVALSNVAQAFHHVRTNMFIPQAGDRPKASNFVVLLTDSHESVHTEETISAAQSLKDTGVGVYSVGIKLNDTYELDSISSKPLDEFQYLIQEKQELENLTQLMQQRMKEVVHSEDGYDIVFMLDMSVDRIYYGWMTNLSSEIVDQLNIFSGQYRIGAITYSRLPKLRFHLNTYGYQPYVFNAINSKFSGSSLYKSSLDKALDYVRTRMFTYSNGDRPQAQNIVIMMTPNDYSTHPNKTLHAAKRLKEKGVSINVVGFNIGDKEELNAVSSLPSDQHRFYVRTLDELLELPRIINSSLRGMLGLRSQRHKDKMNSSKVFINPYL